ncbi:hypothetical protein AMTRI_Chr01g128320 [Amborella trichopoda]
MYVTAIFARCQDQVLGSVFASCSLSHTHRVEPACEFTKAGFMGNCLNANVRPKKSNTVTLSSQTSNSGLCPRAQVPFPSSNKTSAFSINSCGDTPTPRIKGDANSCQNLKTFTFDELKAATRNFHCDGLIGEGGFGFVFKGWIHESTLSPTKPGMGIVVAVKKLKLNGLQGHKEWQTEVNYLGQLHHENLVKLIGYCSEAENKLLVYEFMPKGSLENHLFRRGRHTLPWDVRVKVAMGVAQGLSYLHNAEIQIIYRDLKASNILLDSDFNAKLTDFGFAREGPRGDDSHVSTRVVGTHGYAAPEYLATGRLTTKSDVYSFGVLLLELLSGRRAIEESKSQAEWCLVNWAKSFLTERKKVFRIMDTNLQGQYSHREAQVVATLALQCVSWEAKTRPKMREILNILEQLKDKGNDENPPNRTARVLKAH